MKQSLYLILSFFFIFQTNFGQKINIQKENQKVYNNSKTSLPLDSIKNLYGARYVDYKKITFKNDTIQIDTILNIRKHFAFNSLQKDNFTLNEFNNLGQTFNKLSHDFNDNFIYQQFGVAAKKHQFYDVQDVCYYHVPTPTSIITYLSGFQGQYLNTEFTTNFSPYTNFSIAYKGISSLGYYINERSRQSFFRTTLSYYNPSKRYQFRMHIANQQVFNQENGGLTSNAINEFTADNPIFNDRNRMDVNLTTAESIFKSDRYFWEHKYKLNNAKLANKQWLVGHQIYVDNQHYNFTSTDNSYFNNNSVFGNTTNTATYDKTNYQITSNTFFANVNTPYLLGDLKIFNRFYQTKQIYKYSASPTTITQNFTSLGAEWNARVKNVYLKSLGEQIVNTTHLGTNFHTNLSYLDKNAIKVETGIQIKNSIPQANATYYQSNLVNYNWSNTFKNETFKNVYGGIQSNWLDAKVTYSQINNYVYFNSQSIASQYNNTIDYFKIQTTKEFKIKKIALNNEIMYQKVTQGTDIFRTPTWITRNTLYFTDYLFKGDPLLAQIGITFKYFTKYYANEFNPVLNEFHIQNNQQIGNYPNFDVFVNGEIRRTRIYFKLENVTANYTGRHYFVTPNQPGKDFVIRFGLIWNFFN